jgi:hypothetical protein
MRQKVLLHLEVDQSFAEDYASKAKLLRAVVKCHNKAWPVDKVEEPGRDREHEDSEEENEEEAVLRDVNDTLLFEGMTSEQLVARFELDGVGQQRHWVQQSSRNCCSFSLKPYEGGAPCGNVKRCLYCRAVQISIEDTDYGTITHFSAATLSLFARKHKWTEFETGSIFEFVSELNRRLEGFPALKKELSYYGAIRNTAQELDDAVQASQLLSYHVSMTNNRKGVPFFRMAIDPTNQQYASWLVTLSGPNEVYSGQTIVNGLEMWWNRPWGYLDCQMTSLTDLAGLSETPMP